MNIITIPEIRIWIDKKHTNVHGKAFFGYRAKWQVFKGIKYRTFSLFTPLFWMMIELAYSRI